MKKAVAYINKKALIALLKVPYRIELIGMEYPSKDDRIKITLEGDNLPVEKCGPNSKKFPEVSYTVLSHWHNAKIELKENIKDEPKESIKKESKNGDKTIE